MFGTDSKGKDATARTKRRWRALLISIAAAIAAVIVAKVARGVMSSRTDRSIEDSIDQWTSPSGHYDAAGYPVEDYRDDIAGTEGEPTGSGYHPVRDGATQERAIQAT
ncbi:MAG TPA: hypothetical protein VFZ17_14025 [Acidimicrobiia bacterium]|nr:hypothetical protein [Acidimicrobiia bacterium]